MNTNNEQSYFDKQNNLCADTCWAEYKNFQNDKIMGYTTYDKSAQLLDCKSPNVRVPEFMYDHPNLRGRAGYGLADSCLVDIYSDLIKNENLYTRDRCRIQLTQRIFTGAPQLKGCSGDVSKELDLLSGTDTTAGVCRKNLMELQLKNPIPLVDCMKDIQNPNNIVPIWVNGGEDTRSYVNRQNFNKNIYL
jgi:hypothetical protein